ncbi:hypothetical protein AVEN_175934-1 [Araneus ventricosus]|uniref:Uncharacterized protein n=1 Tax=Araneus ventricosus TaxID=182803 RepID=A0A4Y2QZ26_ARAVE|nr:hypothetical protein AVEN_175934-1 [Araneus ventricosus]
MTLSLDPLEQTNQVARIPAELMHRGPTVHYPSKGSPRTANTWGDPAAPANQISICELHVSFLGQDCSPEFSFVGQELTTRVVDELKTIFCVLNQRQCMKERDCIEHGRHSFVSEI